MRRYNEPLKTLSREEMQTMKTRDLVIHYQSLYCIVNDTEVSPNERDIPRRREELIEIIEHSQAKNLPLLLINNLTVSGIGPVSVYRCY